MRLETPPGWTATPPTQTVAFDRADESQTVRFMVKPGPNTPSGESQVARRRSGERPDFDRGYEVIEYPHIRRYHIYDDAATTLKVINVRIEPNLLVGYVMGVGDQVPPAIEQLGAKVQMSRPRIWPGAICRNTT